MICFKWKMKGFMMASAALSAVVFVLLAASIAGLYSGVFSMLESGKTASAAQRYAEIEGNMLTLLPYDELGSAVHGKAAIAGTTEWQSEVSVSPESTIGEDGRQRIGTVKVYKGAESIPRASLQVPLSSEQSGSLQGSLGKDGWTQLPNGLILEWGEVRSVGIGTRTKIVFPKPFPNACVGIWSQNTTSGSVSNDSRYINTVYALTNTYAEGMFWSENVWGQYNKWFAVGY